MNRLSPLAPRHEPSRRAPPSSSRVPWRSIPLLVLEAALVISWSSGFIVARFSNNYASPFLVAFWRCALVALVLLPWVAGELRRTAYGELLRQACIGLLSLAMYLAFIVKGIEQGVPVGLAALIADLLPIGTALLATTMFRQHLGIRTWMGLAVGLLGVMVVSRDVLAASAASLWACGLPLLAMLSLAVATLWQKRARSRPAVGLLCGLWLQCAVSAAAFAVLAGMDGGLAPVPSTGFALSVFWAATLPTIGGYGLYWVCLKRTSPTRVASVLYLSPAVTMLWARAMFDEPLTWLMLVGTAVSGWGVWIVGREEQARDRRKACAPHRDKPNPREKPQATG